jgi:hypothetical protein
LGKAKIWTPEHKAKRLEHLKRLHLSQKGRARPEGLGTPIIQIEVLDLETGIKTIYPSMKEVARFLGCSSSGTISCYFSRNTKKPYRGRYVMKKLSS